MTDAQLQNGERDENRLAFEQWWAVTQRGSQFDPGGQKEAAWAAWQYLTAEAQNYKRK